MGPIQTVVCGAVLLLWPALWNAYPIVFSDTGAFLQQAAQPDAVFDKPWAYGPFLLALHGRSSLWWPAVAQALILSHTLWLVARRQRDFGARSPVVLFAILAVGSAAPWFASLLMPDIFAPVTVLCLFLLTWGDERRGTTVWLTGLASFAIAAHLTHLVIGLACLAVALLARRPAWRVARPLLLALIWLVAVNALVWQRPALSPYGSVFLLARLTADGVVPADLAASCPAAGGRLCAWRGRLPRDADQFLWSPDGPVWADGYGPTLLADEAGRTVRRVILHRPVAVARAMAGSTLRQLGRVAVGDTLGPQWLDDTVGQDLRADFPPDEQARFTAGRQMRRELVMPRLLNGAHGLMLLAGLLGTLAVLWRGPAGPRGLAAMCLAALLANAFATGALSGPHDRYQARIAWLLLVAGLPATSKRFQAAATCSGGSTTSPS